MSEQKPSPSHAMQCDEIWGGYEPMDGAISVPGLDAWVSSHPLPGHAAGGDIHYVSLCGKGALSRFIIADVSGHGQVVSGLADELRNLMREHIMQPDMTRFVRQLNERFGELAEAGKFATAIAVSFVAPTGQLHIVNAGHPSPLWYRVQEGGWHWLDHHIQPQSNSIMNLPLGVVGHTGYSENRIQLTPGDLVLVFTDSLIEAHNHAGQQLGAKGLFDLVSRIDASDPHGFAEAVLAGVAEHRDGHPADDDETLLVLHRNTHTPEPGCQWQGS